MFYGLSELFKYRNFLERYSVEFLRLAERLEEQIQKVHKTSKQLIIYNIPFVCNSSIASDFLT